MGKGAAIRLPKSPLSSPCIHDLLRAAVFIGESGSQTCSSGNWAQPGSYCLSVIIRSLSSLSTTREFTCENVPLGIKRCHARMKKSSACLGTSCGWQRGLMGRPSKVNSLREIFSKWRNISPPRLSTSLFWTLPTTCPRIFTVIHSGKRKRTRTSCGSRASSTCCIH